MNSTSTRAKRPANQRWAACAYWLAVIAALSVCVPGWDDSPDFLDYDSATIGVFVNDLTSGNGYDATFRDTSLRDATTEDGAVFQAEYRRWWAAQFLPVSIPLSALQQILGAETWHVDRMLKLVGIALGMLGCLLAARLARGKTSKTRLEGVFMIAFLVASPPFLLFLKTTVPHFLLTFFLFWAAVSLIVDYSRNQCARPLYLLAPTLTCAALAPYPPLAVIPVFAVVTLWQRGALMPAVRSKHLWCAVLLFALLWLSVQYVIAVTYEGSLSTYWAKTSGFLGTRSGAISLQHLSFDHLGDKLLKLLNQHLLFRHDNLGDLSRDDGLWTLGTLHHVWLLLAPIGIYGAYRGLRERCDTSLGFATVLTLCYVFALTVSFPEGRYMIVVLPCYAYFVVVGVQSIFKHEGMYTWALTVILLLTSWNTVYSLRQSYNPYILTLSRTQNGIKQALALIRSESAQPSRIILGRSDWNIETRAIFDVYAPRGMTRAGPQGLAELLDSPTTSARVVVLVRANDTVVMQVCSQLGLSASSRFRDVTHDESFVLMARSNAWKTAR